MRRAGGQPDNGRRAFRAGSGILVFFAAMAFAADVLALYPHDFRDAPFLSPSWPHPLGTDDMGRDILTGLMTAGRMSLLIGVSAACAAVVTGTAVGLAAGYARGLAGEFFTGAIDAVLLVPVLPLLVILAAYLGPNSFNIIIVIACIGWCATARAIRAKTLQLREAPFVEALKGLGFSKTRIVFRHLLPNVTEIVSAKFVLSVASAMISEASLGFLGLGDPYRPSWGKMVHDAFQRGGFAGGFWNWYLPPGLCITLCTMGFVLLGFYWEQKDAAERPGEMIL